MVDTAEKKTIAMKFRHAVKSCTVGRNGTCRNCGAAILWVETPAHRWVSADPVQAGSQTTCHLDTCTRRSPQSQTQQAQPPQTGMITMTKEQAEKLLHLVDPTLHQDINEQRAIAATKWLRAQLDKITGTTSSNAAGR